MKLSRVQQDCSSLAGWRETSTWRDVSGMDDFDCLVLLLLLPSPPTLRAPRRDSLSYFHLVSAVAKRRDRYDCGRFDYEETESNEIDMCPEPAATAAGHATLWRNNEPSMKLSGQFIHDRSRVAKFISFAIRKKDVAWTLEYYYIISISLSYSRALHTIETIYEHFLDVPCDCWWIRTVAIQCAVNDGMTATTDIHINHAAAPLLLLYLTQSLIIAGLRVHKNCRVFNLSMEKWPFSRNYFDSATTSIRQTVRR